MRITRSRHGAELRGPLLLRGWDRRRSTQASLIASGHNLFGTTSAGGAYGYGTVFELAPPATPSGSWTEQVIYSFTGGSDGATPLAPLITDKTGTLYGTASISAIAPYSTGFGTVFALKPPTLPGGAWTETVLHSFAAVADGRFPAAALRRGKDGVLYGTTTSNDDATYGPVSGTVFSLTPPSTLGGPWSETVISSFLESGGLHGPLEIGPSGALLGTTRGYTVPTKCGSVFALLPPTSPGGVWKQVTYFILPLSITNICYAGSSPMGVLVGDGSGNFYATTSDGGPFGVSAFGAGTVVVNGAPIYAFTGGSDGGNPTGDRVRLKSGLYGTAAGGESGCGVVFWLQPPSVAGGSWTEKVLHAFAGGSDGSNPASGLLPFQGAFFGTTTQGGAAGLGTVYVVKP